jgi:hypothetical protein
MRLPMLPMLAAEGTCESNIPSTIPAVNLMMVTHADISEEEKKLISGGNLRRPFGNVKENPLCK